MIRIIDYLKNIGLSEIEAGIYESLLYLGPSTVKEISQYMGVNRITTHFNVEKLIEKGLVNQIKKGAKRQLFVESPEKLKYIIDEKIKSLYRYKKSFSQIIEQIKKNPSFKFNKSERIEVKYFIGKKEVYQIYKDVLSAMEVRSYVNLEMVYKIFPQNIETFVEGMKKNKKINIWEIVEDSTIARKETKIFAQNKRYHYKIASLINLSASDVMIYDGKVVVVNLGKNISGTIFYNEEFYQISKEIFDFVWKTIP